VYCASRPALRCIALHRTVLYCAVLLCAMRFPPCAILPYAPLRLQSCSCECQCAHSHSLSSPTIIYLETRSILSSWDQSRTETLMEDRQRTIMANLEVISNSRSLIFSQLLCNCFIIAKQIHETVHQYHSTINDKSTHHDTV
jgi:hypothetical protein